VTKPVTEPPVIPPRIGSPAWRPDPKAPPLKDHPVVVARRREIELALIASWLADHAATRCPTRFCAATPNAEGRLETAPAPPPQADDTPIDNVADAARWLRLNAMVGFDRIGAGTYLRNGRIMTADRVIAEVRRLRDTGAALPQPRRLRARRRHHDPTGGRAAAARTALETL
jgi:hypothetical protein